MIYELKNQDLRVAIDTKGAELRAVEDVRNGKSYLWNGDSAYWGRVSPVLFPLVGNYFEQESVYGNRTYHLGQHGFARDTEFEVLSQSDEKIVFRMTSSETTLAVYPFAFALEIGYVLDGRDLQVLWTVKNADDKEMYFSIGAHPAFSCDLNTAILRFDTDEDLEIEYLNTDTGCLGDRCETVPLTDRALPLSAKLFDDDALILEENQTKEITLLDGGQNPLVKVSFDAPVVGIWSPAKKNAPFVCIEPWYGRSDRDGFDKKLENREYGNRLAVGEAFNASYTIRFYS